MLDWENCAIENIFIQTNENLLIKTECGQRRLKTKSFNSKIFRVLCEYYEVFMYW